MAGEAAVRWGEGRVPREDNGGVGIWFMTACSGGGALAESVARARAVVVFVHGFPELAYSWREQMRAAAEAGFFAVAPDMRGYGQSDVPREVEAYHLRHLTGDLCAILDHLGVQKAVFVGHDWGGHVVWSQVFHNEDRCLGVASLNTPLSSWEKLRPKWEAGGFKGPIDLLASLPSEACGQLDYQVYFNIPDTPERELEADVRRTVLAFFRSQQPGRSRKEHLQNMQLGMRTHKARKDGNRGVLFNAAKEVPRDPLWSEEEMQTYIDAFQRNGFFGPLSWYRNIDANIEWDKETGCSPGLGGRIIQVPCLMVTAEFDVVLAPSESVGMDQHFARLSRGHVACGHWVQREAALDVNSIVLRWIEGDVLASGLKESRL